MEICINTCINNIARRKLRKEQKNNKMNKMNKKQKLYFNYLNNFSDNLVDLVKKNHSNTFSNQFPPYLCLKRFYTIITFFSKGVAFKNLSKSNMKF